jgi:alpha-galactosidase
MRRAADAMVATGLADHGWSYIVVDDCWRTRPTEKEAGMKRPGWIGEFAHMYGPARTPDGYPRTNSAFPDMKAMADYIHSKGLKAGLYSVPSTVGCCWTWGSYGHEADDAAAWAKWGYDLVKYDWCYGDRDWHAAGDNRTRQFKAYKLMGDLLAAQKRDIVYNVCNYGRHGVTEWARAAGGHYWRTNDDLKDTWQLLLRSINENMDVADAAAPGGWNDPDMLVVGPMRSNNFTSSRLTPNEQYAHMSLWAIMAAPLFIGCDMERLDPLARALLTNDEMLDINQDALGKAGRPVVRKPEYDVWLRPLADGSWAVALFNRTWEEREIAVDFAVLGLPAACRVRDVWAQKDLGVFKGRFAAGIPGHAALLYRLVPSA